MFINQLFYMYKMKREKLTPLKKLEDWSTPYCTTKQTADLLGVTIRTVQLWVESGLLEAWRTPGGHRRILVSSLRSYLQGKEKPTQEKRLNVLVVEDDDLLQELYKVHLLSTKMPMQLRFAKNGFEALVNIGQEKPDAIITDLMMPEMDGFTFLRRLSLMPVTANLKVLVVTQLGTEEITEHGGLPEKAVVYQKPIPFAAIESDLQNQYAAMRD